MEHEEEKVDTMVKKLRELSTAQSILCFLEKYRHVLESLPALTYEEKIALSSLDDFRSFLEAAEKRIKAEEKALDELR